MKGLCLVGGGACGEWQAGALRVLDTGYGAGDVKLIAGTSVGALNGCLYAVGLMKGVGSDLLFQAWNEIQRTEDVYTPALPPTPAKLMNPLYPSYMNGLRRFVFGPGFCDVTPLQRLVKKYLGDVTAQDVFEKTGVSIFVRAFNYQTGEVETLGGATSLYDMAMASSAIEGIFPAHNIGGVDYGDGGLLDNAPMDVLIELGADDIHIIYCAPEKGISEERPTTGFSRTLRALGRAIEEHEERVWEECQKKIGVTWHHHYAESSTGSFLDFSKRGLFLRGIREGLAAR